jgi:hypothetical protein
MQVPLFFATSRSYNPGDVVRLNAGQQAPHLNGAAPSWLSMEQAFELAKPVGHHSRLSSRFACETAEDCLTYYLAQPGANKKVYKVVMDDPVAVPMVLTGWGNHHHASPVTLAAIANEYWNKKLHNWEFLEFLAPEMTIIAEVLTPPDTVALATSSISYGNDQAKAKQLWP